jgi:hypothetical protein
MAQPFCKRAFALVVKILSKCNHSRW